MLMMTSNPATAYVWIWLPGATAPVVAGRLDDAGPQVTFTYGRSYLALKGAIPLFLPDLPLITGRQYPPSGRIAGCIADAGPDAWGERVIMNRLLGSGQAVAGDLHPLALLLESGSDRIGALDFQLSPDSYVPRLGGMASLDELAEAAERVQMGTPLSPALADALVHGSSIGGARPKALLSDGDRRLIAKFGATTDAYPVVKGEFIAMELARRAGLDVAHVSLDRALGKDVLLIERFDRGHGGTRRAMVSALTLLGLDEMGGRYASYADLATVIRQRFLSPRKTLRELFSRITFNILTGNCDDHSRNHAAFWDGEHLVLTPAYDICPQSRAGGETSQAMAIGEDGWRYSQVEGCITRCSTFQLAATDAREIVENQISVIRREWADVCDRAGMSETERAFFWERQFLNPYALELCSGPTRG